MSLDDVAERCVSLGKTILMARPYPPQDTITYWVYDNTYRKVVTRAVRGVPHYQVVCSFECISHHPHIRARNILVRHANAAGMRMHERPLRLRLSIDMRDMRTGKVAKTMTCSLRYWTSSRRLEEGAQRR